MQSNVLEQNEIFIVKGGSGLSHLKMFNLPSLNSANERMKKDRSKSQMATWKNSPAVSQSVDFGFENGKNKGMRKEKVAEQLENSRYTSLSYSPNLRSLESDRQG